MGGAVSHGWFMGIWVKGKWRKCRARLSVWNGGICVGVLGGVSGGVWWMENCVVRSSAFCSNVRRGRRTREGL